MVSVDNLQHGVLLGTLQVRGTQWCWSVSHPVRLYWGMAVSIRCLRMFVLAHNIKLLHNGHMLDNRIEGRELLAGLNGVHPVAGLLQFH